MRMDADASTGGDQPRALERSDGVVRLPLPKADALASQVGGDHYKNLAIQPVEYILANGLGFCEGACLKYITRWRSKGGIEDLKKARHFLDMLIEHEQRR